jgi:recombinational DNA repair protein (RecF pathway)
MTREHGLIRCIAKGSKREKSAFSGGLEIATMGHMVAIVKPDSDLSLLTSWDLLEPMYMLRRSLSRYHASMLMIDLVPRLINDHDPHPEIYDALYNSLLALSSEDQCDSPQGIQSQLVWYLWQLLDHTGARPELMVDVVSGAELEEDAQVYGFSPLLGGLTTDPLQGAAHRTADRSMMNEDRSLSDIWRVRRSTVDLMRQLRVGADPSDFREITHNQLVRLGGLLISYIRAMIGSDLASCSLIYDENVLK